MLEMIEALGPYFDADAYLFWTRIQCLAWTTADVVIVSALLLIANHARSLDGVRPHVFPWVVLGMTIILAPFVLVAPTGGLIFLLELLVTVPHFLLILYVMLVNWKSWRMFARTVVFKEVALGNRDT
jgi:hypothetical protein